MIIEFTGIPGVGKSTIINAIFKKFTKPYFIIDIQGFIKNLYLISFPGKIGYDIILLFNFYKLKNEDYLLMSESIKQLLKNNNRITHKLNIFRNIFKKLVINRILIDRSECFLIDEGISHIPISLFVDIDTQINFSKLKDFYQYLPKIKKILLIDADHMRIVDRVIKRGKKGHSRIDFSFEKNIELFILQSKKVIEISKQKLKLKTYSNTDVNLDLDRIIKLIDIKNV